MRNDDLKDDSMSEDDIWDDEEDELEMVDFVGFLDTIELNTIEKWLEQPQEMIENLRSVDDPVDVIFMLDQLGASVELLNIIDDGEIELELELVKDVRNRKKWKQFLHPYVKMTRKQRMTYQNRLEEIHEEFAREAFNISAINPDDLLETRKEQLAFVVGLLSFYGPVIASEEKEHLNNIRESFQKIGEDKTIPGHIREFCLEELELNLY